MGRKKEGVGGLERVSLFFLCFPSCSEFFVTWYGMWKVKCVMGVGDRLVTLSSTLVVLSRNHF